MRALPGQRPIESRVARVGPFGGPRVPRPGLGWQGWSLRRQGRKSSTPNRSQTTPSMTGSGMPEGQQPADSPLPWGRRSLRIQCQPDDGPQPSPPSRRIADAPRNQQHQQEAGDARHQGQAPAAIGPLDPLEQGVAGMNHASEPAAAGGPRFRRGISSFFQSRTGSQEETQQQAEHAAQVQFHASMASFPPGSGGFSGIGPLGSSGHADEEGPHERSPAPCCGADSQPWPTFPARRLCGSRSPPRQLAAGMTRR